MADKKKAVTLALRGKVKWAKVFEQNRDKEGPNGVWKDEGGRYTINIVVDDITKQALKDAKSQKRVKEDSEGDEVVQVERRHNPPTGKDGTVYHAYGGPPRVIHADKSPWDIDEDGLIGNGSEAIVYVSVYEAGGLMGTRLEAVQVLDHVVYESDNSDYDPLAYLGVKDMSEDAKPKAKSSKKKKSSEVEEDEIPF